MFWKIVKFFVLLPFALLVAYLIIMFGLFMITLLASMLS